MTHVHRRRWPIAKVCLVLYAALPFVRGENELDKDEITNSIGMKLKLTKAGKFLMGSPKDERDRSKNEGPLHGVEITRPFYMSVFPVTMGQFAAFVKHANYVTEAEKDGNKDTWRSPFEEYNQTDDDPVVYEKWNDAVKFCEWLSKKETLVHRTPGASSSTGAGG